MAHDAVTIAMDVATAMARALRTVELRRERAARLADEGFAAAGQLVGAIVATGLANWREAHHVVAAIVASARDTDDPAPLRDVVEQACETTDDPLIQRLAPALRSAALDLSARAIVESRGDSGPAPDAMARSVAALEERAAAAASRCHAEHARLAEVWRALEARARDW
jgi:argininosuccinate lyase